MPFHYLDGRPVWCKSSERRAKNLTDKVREQVWDGEVGEVDVGRGVHVLVLEDDQDGRDVAEDPDDEDGGVDHRDGDDGRQGQVLSSQSACDVLGNV